MYRHDVIHKTGSARHIATLPEEDRSTAIANTHKKTGEEQKIGRVVLEI